MRIVRVPRVDYHNFDPITHDVYKNLTNNLLQDYKCTHVGSTAIKIGGKNIVDILVEVSSKEEKSLIKKLVALNYGKVIPRRKRRMTLFRRQISFQKSKYHIHIHMTRPNSIDARRMKFFIDYLKTHPKSCKKYIQLKKEALALGKIDNASYNIHKHDFIWTILNKMKK